MQNVSSGASVSQQAYALSEEHHHSPLQFVWTASPDGAILETLPLRPSSHKKTARKLRDTNWLVFVQSDDRERVLALWTCAQARPDYFEVETLLCLSSDRCRPFQIRAIPLLDDAGVLRQWIGVCTDITERQIIDAQLLEHLRESEMRFSVLFDQAAVGIAYVALDGRWLRVNQKLCAIVGYTREELLNLTVQDITFQDDLEMDRVQHNRLLAGEIQTYVLEKRCYRPDRSLLWINLTVSLVRDSDGTPQYCILVIEDISERKRAEEERTQLLQREAAARVEVARRASQLEATSLALQEANDQLALANKLQSDFISMISHEFRTTLSGIQGFSELIRDREISSDCVKEFADDIFADARRLSRMINELLDLERMKSGRMTLHHEQVDLNAILEAAAERTRSTTQQHTITVQMAEKLPLVSGDSDKLMQVVANLLSNAVKYSPVGGQIVLGSEIEEQQVHVYIQDHGIGIPHEALEQIFTPYNRVESSSTRYIKGTGLGLPIVRQIVQMHGGRVWAESTPGQGSVFHFTLPL